ncbi:ROK family protein, partial [Paenibacillus sepulcri]|nr:ROK family protein [Paenibacillus sepulcri]
LVHGINGGAGEIGHLSVDWQGPRCMCGNIGCLELYASGTGIVNRYVMKRELAGLDFAGKDTAAGDVIARWREGEPLAVEVMNEAIAALGTAVTSLIHIFNPELIIIGGGIAGL